MEKYDITKVDIFSLSSMMKRGDFTNSLALLTFFYSKYDNSPKIEFKYSEISWLYYHNVLKIVNLLESLGILTILKKPTKKNPFIIELKSNNELHALLNKNKKIQFHKYNQFNFSRSDFEDALECSSIHEHFIGSVVSSWIRNINNNVWDINRFLIVSFIVSHFSGDFKIKTFTVNKHCSKNSLFSKSVVFLYEKLSDSKKEIVYLKLDNTLRDLKIKHDKSFSGMVREYYKFLKKKEVKVVSVDFKKDKLDQELIN